MRMKFSVCGEVEFENSTATFADFSLTMTNNYKMEQVQGAPMQVLILFNNKIFYLI